MPAATPGARRATCPACAAAIRRVPRSGDDRRTAHATAMRRYACTGAGCGWQGLLPRQPRRAPAWWAGRAASSPGRTGGRPAVLAAAAGVALVLAAAGQRDALLAQPGPAVAAEAPVQWLPPGGHHEGVALSLAHPLLRADDAHAPDIERLALRQGCAWGKPGRNPYRGSVEQALVTARLPAAVVQRIAHKVRTGQPDDRLEIRNEGIRAARDGRGFDPRNVALTYGHTLCVNARVNFPAGHAEPASLYEAADDEGRLHSVMVPDVCGNVSVLGARMERRRARPAVLAETPHGGPQLLLVRAEETAGEAARRVPEPGTPALLGAGLAAAAVLAWARRRSRRPSSDPARRSSDRR